MKKLASVLLTGVSTIAAASPVMDVPAPTTTISRQEMEKLPVNRDFSDLLQVCPAQTMPSIRPGSLVSIDGYPAREQMNCLRPDDLRMIAIYKGHNAERALYGSPPLVWDPSLATGAQDYARQLTTLGRVHASREGRKDIRENLLQSLNGQRSPEEMIRVWAAEKQDFKYGVFPDISRTGDWSRVGHYTQMIWPTTTRIGCAIHSDARFDWTVCRYSPPGNRDGSTLLAAPLPIIRCNPRTDGMPSPIGTYTYRIHFDPGRPAIGRDGKSQVIGDGPRQKPPPESILDDIGDATPPKPPPESILDDIGDHAATDPAPRPCPAPLPATDTRRVHETPMAQPIGPAGPEPAAPVPTAADPAPAGYEFAHPLNFYFEDALEILKSNPLADIKSDLVARRLALLQMRYAYEEMLKRYKAAKTAGDMSEVKPENVKKVLDHMETELRRALNIRRR